MNTTAEMDITTIYGHTTAVLGSATLIMGTTLHLFSKVMYSSEIRSKTGLKFLAAAMFLLSLINLFEYITGINSIDQHYSLAIVLFAASTQLFLMFMAYMSMLCKQFPTRRRIYIEIICIILFTSPTLFISPVDYPVTYNVLFAIGVIFYCTKFISNFVEFRKQMKITKKQIENILSEDSKVWLEWINSTFYVVISVGIISIIAPITDIAILIFYNSYVIIAYSYVYFLIIKKISIFDKRMELLEVNEVECVEIKVQTPDASLKSASDFIETRKELLDNWIANRGYAIAGITATDVAKSLKTNRTRLSLYLKTDLNTTYYDWIANFRIEDAKQQLIKYPDRAIYEIALNVGIEDRDNFRHLFKKIVGVSPTIYRKQNCN